MLGQTMTSDNNGSGASGTTGTAGVPDVLLASTYNANGSRVTLAATLAGTADFKNSYTYNSFGDEEFASQQGNGGNAVTDKEGYFNFYGAQGHLESISGYGGPSFGQFPLYEDFAYDHDGDMTSLYAWGYTSTLTENELEHLTLSYNSDQQLTESINSIHSGEDQYNTYDHDGQLTNSSPSGFESGGTNFGFDSNGNVSGTGDTVGEGNAQLSANGYSYQFDAAGNMTQQTDPSGNVTTYTWDNRDRLVGATLKNSSGVIQKVVDYTYDAFNQLIGESVTPYSGGVAGATATQRFVYDPLTGEMQLAFNGSGSLTDRYLWGPLVDEVLADEKVTSLSYGGTLEWFATNNEQSVTDVYEYGTSGTLLDHIGYDAFGGIASQTNSSNAPQFGYDGVYTDPATGMQYHNDPNSGMRGRWYLPWLQRWASRDDIFPLSGTNPFEYCGNDPTSYIDPSGLQDSGNGPNGGSQPGGPSGGGGVPNPLGPQKFEGVGNGGQKTHANLSFDVYNNGYKMIEVNCNLTDKPPDHTAGSGSVLLILPPITLSPILGFPPSSTEQFWIYLHAGTEGKHGGPVIVGGVEFNF
jgi:RHS repeat-associated protein